MQALWVSTPYRVVCDADLLYTVSDTEPCSAVQSLMAIIDPRPTVCATLTGPTPAHLIREYRLFYTCKHAVRNVDAWLDEIRKACKAWQVNKEHRFAVNVGSKGKQFITV